MNENNKNLDDVSNMIEHKFKPEKNNESVSLLKQKMSKTQNLIKLYMKKVKEAELLKSDLESAKKDARHVTFSYKSVINKTRELELNITELKQRNNELTSSLSETNEYKLTMAADKKTVEQLLCKIKEMEDEYSVKLIEHNVQKSIFEDRIKDLEHELKILKKSEHKKEKRKVLTNNNITQSHIDMELPNAKPEVQDKCIMTDEFYHIKDNPYPLFCDKCEKHLFPVPCEKICKMMSECPKLIEPITSPKKISPLSRSPSNRQEEKALDKVLLMPNLHSPYNDPNLQFEISTIKTQSLENVELAKDFTEHKPITTNPCSNSNLISATTSQIAKKDSCSDLLARTITGNTFSIKKIKRKIYLLESKIKQLEKLQKQNTNHSCLVNSNLLNANLLVEKFHKNMLEFYNEQEIRCKNKNVISKKYNHMMKQKLLNRRNMYKNEFSWKVEHLRNKSQDMLSNESQHKLEPLHINKSNLISHLDTSSKSLEGNDRLDREFFSTKVMSDRNDSEILHSSTNEMCINDNLLNKDKAQSIDSDYQTVMKTSLLFNDENSISRVDSDINDSIAEENNCQNKEKIAKNSCSETISNFKEQNKRKNIRLSNNSSKYCKPAKRQRTAHIKAVVLQSNIVQTDSTDGTVKIAAGSEESNLYQKYKNPQLTVQMQNNSFFANSIKDSTTDMRSMMGFNAVKCNEMSIDIDEEPVNEENLDLHVTEIEESVINDNIAPSVNMKNVSEFGKCDIILTENANNKDVSMETLTMETSNKSNVLDLLDNEIRFDAMKDLQCKKLVPLEAHVIIRPEPNISCKNLQDKLIENAQASLHMNKQKDIDLFSDYDSKYTSEPAKKQRIAHIPRILAVRSSVDQQNSIHYTINDKFQSKVLNLKQIQTRNQRLNALSRKNSLSVKNKNDMINKGGVEKGVIEYAETCSTDERSIVKEKGENSIINNDVSSSIDIERIATISKLDECIVPAESTSNENVSTEEITIKTSSNNGRFNVLHNNVSLDMTKDLELEKLMPSKADVRSESSTFCKDSQLSEFTEDAQAKIIETVKDITPAVESVNNKADDSRAYKDHLSNNIVKELQDTRNQIAERYINSEITNILDVNAEKKNTGISQEEKEIAFACSDVSHDDVKEAQTLILSRLNRYINEETSDKLDKKMKMQIRKKRVLTDAFVKEQLKKLINDDKWEDSVHNDVIKKLSACGPRIIAKCVIEFLSECCKHEYILEKNFTPPAPLMTKFQQKILALLVDLEISKPGVISFVQAGIEYKLFKFNKLSTVDIDSATRIYVALARIQNDREKVRIMCCDALYSMGLRAISLLYTVLTCWPEIFPDADANKEILPKCIAFLITSQQTKGSTNYPKLLPLKTLIISYYKYISNTTKENLVEEFITALKGEQRNGLDMAILLTAKREGASWMYKNIVKPVLLPMIINHKSPCIYSAFSLLGQLMYAYPLKAKNSIVKNISKQLSDILASGEGSHDQQEGVASALLNLSKHEFNIVVTSLIKWTPHEPLRPNTIAQIEGLMRTHSLLSWKNFIRKNIQRKCIENKKPNE